MSEAPAGHMGFQKAEIPVEKVGEFDQLRGAIERCFAPEKAEKLLRRLERKSIRIRDWDTVLKKKIFEDLDEELKRSGRSAAELYGSLAVSDQAQMRELYLTKLEQVEPALRHKFNKIYAYY